MSRFCFAVCLLLAVAVAATVSTVVITQAAEPAGWPTAPAVQVTVPPSAYAEEAAAATKAPAATRAFKSALGNAAAQAFREGKITRWQLARLRMAIAFRHDVMAEAQGVCNRSGLFRRMDQIRRRRRTGRLRLVHAAGVSDADAAVHFADHQRVVALQWD